MTSQIPAPPEVRIIPINQLVESPLNNRKYYDPVKLDELAANIRQVGVQQPILTRPKGDGFEIIFGSRRFRASQKAEMPGVPCFVRDMSDDEAMELMLIENVQREGISELEEAQGFQHLLDLNKRLTTVLTDAPKITADTIAAKIGKSREYVYGRLKLLAAGKKATKAFNEGKLSAGHLVQIARLSTPVQEETVAVVDQAEKEGRPMSVKELGRYIASRYLDLRVAPFDRTDAELLPKAGACINCPKFSGKNPDVLADLSKNERNPFTCTDRSCYGEKLDAFWTRKEEEIAKETGKKPTRISTSYNESASRGAIRHGEWKPVSPKKTCPHVHLGLIVATESYELEKLGQTVEICTTKKCPVHGEYQHREVVEQAAPSTAARKADEGEAHRKATIALIVKKLSARNQALRQAALLFLEQSKAAPGVTRVQVQGAPPKQLPGLMLTMVLQNDLHPAETAMRLGIAVPKPAKPVQTSTRSKGKAEKGKGKKATPVKAKAAKRPAKPKAKKPVAKARKERHAKKN